MKIFGRKRYAQRQAHLEQRIHLQHHLGIAYGKEMFRQDVRPNMTSSDDPVEHAFRSGVLAGYTAAEMEFEDEVGWWLREQAAQGQAQLESFLAHPYAAPPAPWPTDDGPLDIHGGDEVA